MKTNFPKIEIIQAVSPAGDIYLIHSFKDKNTLPSFEIYKMVKNCREVAREFGIDENKTGCETKLNTRVMCAEMVKKIKKEMSVSAKILKD